MIIVPFIFMLICIYHFCKILANKREADEYIIQNDINKDQIIAYDLNDNKYRIRVIFFSLIGINNTAMGALLVNLGGEILSVILYILLLFIFVALVLYNIVIYIKASVYLDKIKKSGYIVPENRADYSYLIENLVINGQQTLEENEPLRDKVAIVQSIISGFIFLACMAYNVYFGIHYYYFGNDDHTILVIMSILDMVWLINALVLFVKSDNKKYKNTKQNVLGRKNRTTIAGFIAFLIIIGFFTFMVKNALYSMSLYIFKSRCAVNQQWVDSYRMTFNEALNEDYDITGEKLEELKAGTDVTKWENDCEFTDYILEYLKLDSFNEFKKNLKNVYEEPQVIVTLVDKEVEVTITGVYTAEVIY